MGQHTPVDDLTHWPNVTFPERAYPPQIGYCGHEHDALVPQARKYSFLSQNWVITTFSPFSSFSRLRGARLIAAPTPRRRHLTQRGASRRRLAAKRSEAVANEAAARRVRAELGKEAAPPVPQIQYFLKRPILVELRQMSNHRLAMIRYHADWYRDYLRRIEAKKLLGYYQSNGEIIEHPMKSSSNDCLLKRFRNAEGYSRRHLKTTPLHCQYGEETWWRSMTNEAPFKSEGGGEFGSFAEAASFIEPLAQSFGSFWEHKRTIGTTGLTVQHCFHEAFELTKNSTDKVTRKSIVEKLAEKLGTNHHYDAIRGVLPDTGHESDLVQLLQNLESQGKIVRCASKPTKYAMLRLKPECESSNTTGQGGLGGPGYV